MPELRDLPELARDVRERAVPPPYDDVSRRVRARRRRATAGTLATAVLVVGGLAVWQSVATTPPTHHTQPADSSSPVPPTDETQWRSVVEGEQAHPFEYASTYDGSVAVVWRSLVHPEPTFALVVREADGTVHGVRIDAPVTLTPVEGGWVGVHVAQGWLIGTDGSWTSLGVPEEPRRAQAQDVVVRGALVPVVYSPTTRSWATLAVDSPVDQAYVTPAGVPVTCATDVDQLTVEVDSAPVAVLRGRTCQISGQGDQVVVAGVGDRADGSVPLVSLLRSDDRGQTWQELAIPSDLDLTSLATGTDGTAYMTGTDGRLFVTLPGGDLVEAAGEHGVVFTTYDRVYALAFAQGKAPMAFSDDRGSTWQEIPLPGMRSSEK